MVQDMRVLFVTRSCLAFLPAHFAYTLNRSPKYEKPTTQRGQLSEPCLSGVPRRHASNSRYREGSQSFVCSAPVSAIKRLQVHPLLQEARGRQPRSSGGAHGQSRPECPGAGFVCRQIYPCRDRAPSESIETDLNCLCG